jgi:signal transduction histidine kinase
MVHQNGGESDALAVAGAGPSVRTGIVAMSPRAISVIVVAVSLIVLAGWTLGVPILTSFGRGGVTMKANTALGLLFSAASLWFLAGHNSPREKALGYLCSAVTLFIGAATLAAYMWGTMGWVDQLVFHATTDTGRTATPGRMAASTALTFVIMALSLLTLDVTVARRVRISQVLTSIGLLIPLTTLLGYAYAVIPFVGLGQGVQMAVHTAVCIIVLDWGLFTARPHAGVMQTLTSPRAGGALARRLLPYAFVLPLVLGGLRLAGETAGWYTVPLGSAFVAVATMLILSALIWRTARELNRSDRAREQAFSALNAEQIARAGAESARAQAEDAERRLAIVAEASQLLSSSFDARVILDRLSKLTVPVLADWCFVDVLEENGTWQRVAIAYGDAGGIDTAAKFRRQFRRRTGERYSAAQAMKTFHVPNVTDDVLRSLAQDDEHLALLRELGMHAYVTVPLHVRDRLLGAITFIASSSRAAYSPADIALLEELAHRGSTAIDNARLYQGALAGAQTKVEFLSTISHELRTPLTAILGYTSLLEDGISGPLEPLQEEHIGHVRNSADHLLELIDDILTFSKLESGRATVNRESVIVADALEEAARLVAPLAEQRGLELTVERPHEFMILETDAIKLRQILVNLLNNAVKFTERGSVKVRAWPDVNDVVFEVRDTGIGIEAEDVERVFEAFTQVDQRLTRKVGGMGLGLGVAKRLCSLLGGEISVASRPGRGSTFYVRLPFPTNIGVTGAQDSMQQRKA